LRALLFDEYEKNSEHKKAPLGAALQFI